MMMINFILISSIFYPIIIFSDVIWDGHNSSISPSNEWDSKEVESNSSLDGNLTSFVWKIKG
jgi:hypothetical protein